MRYLVFIKHRPFKTLLITVATLLLLCVAWYFFLYLPKAAKMEALKRDTEEVLMRVRSFRVSDEQVASLQQTIDSMRDEIEEFERKLLPKSRFPYVIHQIQGRGREHGLRFIQVVPEFKDFTALPDSIEGFAHIVKLTVHMKMQGGYRSFGDFLNSLANLPFYVSVGDVALLYNQSIHPEIDILVDVILYLRDEENTNPRT